MCIVYIISLKKYLKCNVRIYAIIKCLLTVKEDTLSGFIILSCVSTVCLYYYIFIGILHLSQAKILIGNLINKTYVFSCFKI